MRGACIRTSIGAAGDHPTCATATSDATSVRNTTVWYSSISHMCGLANLVQPLPSKFCPNKKHDVGDQGHAENDNHKRGYFDDGKPSHVKCPDALLGGSRANALI